MSSCTLLQNNPLDLGVVLVKFDQILGPLVLSNESSLDENLLMKLAIKGTTTLMNGLPYSTENSRRFRGLLQLSDHTFVYGFDLLLTENHHEEDSFTPVILFLVFPSHSVPIIGSNIKKIESTLFRRTQDIVKFSNLKPELSLEILSEFQNFFL